MQKTASIESGDGEPPINFREDTSHRSARFRSILSEFSNVRVTSADVTQPEFFRDLNFDQVVDAITAGREEYDLKPFLYVRLTNLSAIAYRHEVMRDLEQDVLFEGIKMFSDRMRRMRARLLASEKSYYKYQKEALFLEATEIYCEAVEGLIRTLREHSPTSQGLLTFKDFLARYTVSVSFTALANEAKKRRSELSAKRQLHSGVGS